MTRSISLVRVRARKEKGQRTNPTKTSDFGVKRDLILNNSLVCKYFGKILSCYVLNVFYPKQNLTYNQVATVNFILSVVRGYDTTT